MATVRLYSGFDMSTLPTAWVGGASSRQGSDRLEWWATGTGVYAGGIDGAFHETPPGSLNWIGTVNKVTIAGIPAYPLLTIATTFKMSLTHYNIFKSGNFYDFVQIVMGGNDTVYGSGRPEVLIGFSGNDTLIGGPAGDSLFGFNGNDTASYVNSINPVVADLLAPGANEGDADGDTYNNIENLAGSRFNDALRGNDNSNRLIGDVGNDTLRGRGGADMLEGGTGRDILFGDLGADDFVFISVADSRGALRDTIRDFSRAQGDDIWLNAIDANTKAAGNQAFTFIGAAAFTGKPGQLRFQKVGADTHIMGDVNGDKIADITIVSDLVVNFVKGDFVL